MPNFNNVRIARNFQRSVRIDTDLNLTIALDGFICPKSSADVLVSMANHIKETQQGAFTWTGPYGSGKSSLVIALSALLSNDVTVRHRAVEIMGEETSSAIHSAFPVERDAWRIIPVVGRKETPLQVIGAALLASGYLRSVTDIVSNADLLKALQEIAGSEEDAHNGVVLFIDEMGKFMEAAANDGDIYLLQEIAEIASRSKGRLIVVGILHQAFQDYANRISREQQKEWAKIQGRFIDLAVNTAGEEQLDLLSRAIISEPPAEFMITADAVGKLITHNKRNASKRLSEIFFNCWPLHPITAAMLGPISRRRFGQNQRSIFGFLSSAEVNGFQDFTERSTDSLYHPHQLWDYLANNLETSIASSPDGNKWLEATSLINRCEALSQDEELVKLLKTICLVNLFRDNSGVSTTYDFLNTTLDQTKSLDLRSMLDRLIGMSVLVFKKFDETYALFQGSDFDVEKTLDKFLDDGEEIDFLTIRNLAGLQPILAKRHYHVTGSLRWFDVHITSIENAVPDAVAFTPKPDSIGAFILAFPTMKEGKKKIAEVCKSACCASDEHDIVVGHSDNALHVTSLAKEMVALDRIRRECPELQGDKIARETVEERIDYIRSLLEIELEKAFNNAVWYQRAKNATRLNGASLNALASDLADKRFSEAPRIHNELVNRVRPSNSAMSARKALVSAMISNVGKDRLGIVGYPAEGGLFVSLLEGTGLYSTINGQGIFRAPTEAEVDPANLTPLWEATKSYLASKHDRSVGLSEIYNLWSRAPFGIKEGLHPILITAFIMSHKNNVAFYLEDVFQTTMSGSVETITRLRNHDDIKLRWMQLSDTSGALLEGIARVCGAYFPEVVTNSPVPLDVARAIISVYDGLPEWSKRTLRVSPSTLQLRNVLKKATDPNALLFNDIPQIIGDAGDVSSNTWVGKVVDTLGTSLSELVSAYPTVIENMRNILHKEIQINGSDNDLENLRARAENIKQLTGEFRLDAFINRLATYNGHDADIEGLASLLTNKPPRDWIDTDIDKANLALVEFAGLFNKTEAFARVKGRRGKRHAFALIMATDEHPEPIICEFDVNERCKEASNSLAQKLQNFIGSEKNVDPNVVMAALAKISTNWVRKIQN